MCQRKATRVIGASLVAGESCRRIVWTATSFAKIAAPAPAGAGCVLTFVLDPSAHPAGRRGAHREGRCAGRSWPRCCSRSCRRRSASRSRWRVLLGILIGFGRLSGRPRIRRACRPAASACSASSALSSWSPLVATAATAYEIIVALPDANQTFREITFNVVASRVESDVKPSVFFEDFPNRCIYVRDLPAGRRLARCVLRRHHPARPDHGLLRARGPHPPGPRPSRSWQLELTTAPPHRPDRASPTSTRAASSSSIVIRSTRDRVPAAAGQGRPRDDHRRAARRRSPTRRSGNQASYRAHFMIQQKFSLPVGCPVLALIGLALGASNRKDGKLASFALGFGVIFVYYVLLLLARAAAIGGAQSRLAAVDPQHHDGASPASCCSRWRARSDRADRFSCRLRRASATASDPSGRRRRIPAAAEPVVVVIAFRTSTARPSLLDLYMVAAVPAGLRARVSVAALGVFYISTFIDLADKLFRGVRHDGTLLRIFYFRRRSTCSASSRWAASRDARDRRRDDQEQRADRHARLRDQPLSHGRAAAALRGRRERRALRAAGTGPRRANREADRLNRDPRISGPDIGALNRRWVVGQRGDLYHYEFFDPRANQFTRCRLSTRRRTPGAARRHVRATRVAAPEPADVCRPGGPTNGWRGRLTMAGDGGRDRRQRRTCRSPSEMLPLEPPSISRGGARRRTR